MKKLLPFLIFASVVVLVGYAVKKSTSSSPSSDRLTVSASFYPLYFFAKTVGGDLVHVVNMTPAGVEPHDYEPTTKDISLIEESKILLVNGNSFEPWLNRIDTIIEDKDILVVETSEGLDTQEEFIQDPHIWLDPNLAKDEVSQITKALNTVDPTNMVAYGTRADELQVKLIELDEEFRNGLTDCKQKSIVTSHSAFGYLADRYGFEQMAILGISPDEEPSTRKMADITKFIRENEIKYVFFEELVSTKLSETLAQETGTQILALNPLEGLTKEQEDKGEDYFTIQRKNLENLKIALECN